MKSTKQSAPALSMWQIYLSICHISGHRIAQQRLNVYISHVARREFSQGQSCEAYPSHQNLPISVRNLSFLDLPQHYSYTSWGGTQPFYWKSLSSTCPISSLGLEALCGWDSCLPHNLSSTTISIVIPWLMQPLEITC